MSKIETPSESIRVNPWFYLPDYGKSSRVIEPQAPWCETIFQKDPKLLMWYDQAVTRMGEGLNHK